MVQRVPDVSLRETSRFHHRCPKDIIILAGSPVSFPEVVACVLRNRNEREVERPAVLVRCEVHNRSCESATLQQGESNCQRNLDDVLTR